MKITSNNCWLKIFPGKREDVDSLWKFNCVCVWELHNKFKCTDQWKWQINSCLDLRFNSVQSWRPVHLWFDRWVIKVNALTGWACLWWLVVLIGYYFLKLLLKGLPLCKKGEFHFNWEQKENVNSERVDHLIVVVMGLVSLEFEWKNYF